MKVAALLFCLLFSQFVYGEGGVEPSSDFV